MKKKGDPNMFQYGYDPTRSITEFHKHINSLKKVARERKALEQHLANPQVSPLQKKSIVMAKSKVVATNLVLSIHMMWIPKT